MDDAGFTLDASRAGAAVQVNGDCALPDLWHVKRCDPVHKVLGETGRSVHLHDQDQYQVVGHTNPKLV